MMKEETIDVYYWTNEESNQTYFGQQDAMQEFSRDNRFPLLFEWVGKDNIVLDLGMNNGLIGNSIGKKNIVIGVDTPVVVMTFKKNYKNLVGIAGHVQEMPYLKDGYFDGVFAGDVLIHLKDPGACLREAHRVTKDKGFLIISQPVKLSTREGEFIYNDFHEDKMKALVESNGFEQVKIYYYKNVTTDGVMVKYKKVKK